MNHTYGDYKRPTSEQKTYTDWKGRAGNKYAQQTDRGKKARVAIIISDKIDSLRKKERGPKYTQSEMK